jgi:hypothetical protein
MTRERASSVMDKVRLEMTEPLFDTLDKMTNKTAKDLYDSTLPFGVLVPELTTRRIDETIEILLERYQETDMNEQIYSDLRSGRYRKYPVMFRMLVRPDNPANIETAIVFSGLYNELKDTDGFNFSLEGKLQRNYKILKTALLKSIEKAKKMIKSFALRVKQIILDHPILSALAMLGTSLSLMSLFSFKGKVKKRFYPSKRSGFIDTVVTPEGSSGDMQTKHAPVVHLEGSSGDMQTKHAPVVKLEGSSGDMQTKHAPTVKLEGEEVVPHRDESWVTDNLIPTKFIHFMSKFGTYHKTPVRS